MFKKKVSSYAFRLSLTNSQKPSEEIKDKPEEATSFVFGRTNIVRGKTDTLQEVSMAIKAKGIKNNLLKMLGKSETLSPSKLNHAFGAQQLSGQILSRDISLTDSEPGSLNDSSEIGRLGGVDKPEEVEMKVTKVKNTGIINNPFSEAWCTEKDISGSMRGAMSEQVIKQSLLVFSSQGGLSTKSEELQHSYKVNS